MLGITATLPYSCFSNGVMGYYSRAQTWDSKQPCLCSIIITWLSSYSPSASHSPSPSLTFRNKEIWLSNIRIQFNQRLWGCCCHCDRADTQHRSIKSSTTQSATFTKPSSCCMPLTQAWRGKHWVTLSFKHLGSFKGHRESVTVKQTLWWKRGRRKRVWSMGGGTKI